MATTQQDSPGAEGKQRTRLCRVASLLLSEGLVDEQALLDAQQRQKGAKRPLGEVLLEQGLVSEDDYVRVLAQASRLLVVSEKDLDPDPDVQKLVSMEVAQRLGILPLYVSEGDLIVATSDPFQILDFDELAARTDLRVRPFLAAPSAVRNALRRAREGEETLDNLLKHAPDPEGDVRVVSEAEESSAEEASHDTSLGDMLTLDTEGQDAPVVRLLNLVLTDAIRQGASDIHIEPEKDRVRIRFRIDGDLREALEVPANVRHRVLSRLKIVSRLVTTETRVPQDGRAKVALGGRQYDLRVSTIPSYFGEKAVIRILDAHAKTFSLDNSGIASDVLTDWRELLHKPQGLILVTGPTGSGKSTTLYASLLELRSPTKNIVTVEDPVEYQFPGIVHVPVRSDIGMTFAAALRSILRQDPDIVLVGEIRDQETAEVALRAAMTGHLVLSTLHTNDAASTLGRLLDLGVSPQLLATSVLGVMAQRLVATNCPECSGPAVFPEAELARLKVDLPGDVNDRTRQGVGCDACHGTGSKGRTAIVELIRATPAFKELIERGATEAEIRAQADRDGTRSLFAAGVEKILEGCATPEAVLGVTAPPLDEGETPAPDAAASASAPPPILSLTPEGPAAESVAAQPRSRACTGCGEALQPRWRACPVCAEPVPTHGAGRVAAICDDSPVVRKLVHSALAPLFDTIVQAENGRECLDVIARLDPELLVIDQEMPLMKGKDVIQTLRSRLSTASLPILMLTAIEDDDLEGEILEAGADDYLQKPITIQRLRVRARALLAAAQRRAGAPAEAGVPRV